jgi:two-component system sensor histidine kinase/response regulator
MTDPSSPLRIEPLGHVMRDLVALSVLPTVWQRSDPREVAESLAIVLEKTLPLALVGVLFESRGDAEARQLVRRAGRFLDTGEADAVVHALEPTLRLAERTSQAIDDPAGGAAMRLVCVPIPWQGGRWLLFAASGAADFPSPGERLLLNAGASHAAVALDRCMAFKLLRDNEERFRESEERWRNLTRQTQESAESASREKDELLANVSHEIRTPMNAVLGMTELALDSQLTDEQRSWLETVKASGEHLLVIVNRLLDFSKGEVRRPTLEPAAFDLRVELASLIRTVAVRAQQKDLELLCDVDDAVPERLIGDAGKLRQVLLNLVDNAIKFTALGEVQVLVTCSDAAAGSADEVKLTFSVRDTGIGIPSHLHALIFEAFTQADSSTTRQFGGTGLGLTIAASLTALLGGTIVLASEPDVGSTFTLGLRFQRAPGAPACARESSLPAVRALIVDNNPAARGLLTRWLTDWQMEASAVADGLSAMQVLMASARTSAPIRLLLVDGKAPGVPSARTQASASRRGTGELRLLAVEPNIEAGGLRSPREVVIQKPVVKAELYAGLCRLLSPHEGSWSPPRLPQPAAPTHDGWHVLVAEDNEFSAMLARELLMRRGHSVEVVRDGAAVLAALESARYDVLLLDLHMPGLDGFEVIGNVRARERLGGSRLPVVALTARARPVDRERCLAAGMDDVLVKPVSGAALSSAIQRVLEGRRAAP